MKSVVSYAYPKQQFYFSENNSYCISHITKAFVDISLKKILGDDRPSEQMTVYDHSNQVRFYSQKRTMKNFLQSNFPIALG